LSRLFTLPLGDIKVLSGINATTSVGLSGVVFAIPPRILSAPFARCVPIIFVRFVGGSNMIAAFSAPLEYALVAPVVELLA
jgi:hypothetical protein